MSHLNLRDEFVIRFAALGGVRRATAHDEEFDLAELVRVGAKATPHILVTPMRIGEPFTTAGSVNAECTWAAVVITRRGDSRIEDNKSKGDVASIIAARVVRTLHDDGFSFACGKATKIEARNVSNAAKSDKGVTVWLVMWDQAAELNDTETVVLNDLDAIVTRTDVSGDGESDASTVAGSLNAAEEEDVRELVEGEADNEPIAQESL